MVTPLECKICQKTFTQKSSLARHSRRCTPGPAPSLRQKSCRQCTASKTKCDLARPYCSRCLQRKIQCEYIIPLTRGTRAASPIPEPSSDHTSIEEYAPSFLDDLELNSLNETPTSISSVDFTLYPPLSFSRERPTITTPSVLEANKDAFKQFPLPFPTVPQQHSSAIDMDLLAPTYENFAGLQTPTSNASSVNTPESARLGIDSWLLPVPANTTPPLVRHSMEVILRVMKTWPRMLAKGLQPPPMLHASYMCPGNILQPLANCITIAKMWAGQHDGASDIVRETVLKEMKSLLERYRSFDEMKLLSATQAIAMYIIMLLFHSKDTSTVAYLDPSIFINIQRLIYDFARSGLILGEEKDRERPKWESWIHVTAKRRAVLTIYVLHWSYSVYHSLPSFNCYELGFMPAPAPKFLWQASSREIWEEMYNRWLAQWDDNPYMMREFEWIQPGPTLDRRTEMWLEDTDEFGVLFLSLVNATEREEIYQSTVSILQPI